jgi:Tfp pilus assembly protein PilX
MSLMYTIHQKYKDDNGMILLGTLLIVSLTILVASISVTSTFTEIKISSNYRTGKQAYYIAEAGVQHAKAELRTVSFNDVLDGTYSGKKGILFKTDIDFAGGTYDVKVQDNDDGDENYSVDTDNIVNIISTGVLPNGSKASVEIMVEKTEIQFPPIPAPITIIGEADTSISNSLNIVVDGRDWRLTDNDKTGPTGFNSFRYAIALSNIGSGVSPQTPANAIAGLDNDIRNFQEANFIGKPTAYIESIGLDTEMKSKDLQDFINFAKLVADPLTGSIADLGSNGSPKIIYFGNSKNGYEKNVEFGDLTGSGILIIEGTDLIFWGSLYWTGIIVVIGDDVGAGFMGDGNKVQTINGALIVDEQDEDYPLYKEIMIKGNVRIRYSSEAVEMAQNLVFKKGVGGIRTLTWRQL